MKQKNSDRFLTAFNRIELALKEIVGAKNYLPFYRLITLAKKKTAIVQKYQDDLRTFADLRNAILHNRTDIDYVIAEPHIEVVKKIEEIDRLLNSPLTVFQLYRKKVHSFQTTDSLGDVLKTIHKYKFTQFPVYEKHKFVGLLTTVSITNWLASVSHNGRLPKNLPKLSSLDWSRGNGTNFHFVPKNTSVIDAEEMFKNKLGREKRLEALLITENGRPNEKLLGIVTPMDLVQN